MNEKFKRVFFGLIFILIIWNGVLFSEISFRLVFIVIGLISLYEMWRLRNGKSKFFPLLFIVIPFTIIHFYEIKNTENHFDPSIILFILMLTWIFDTFAYIFGIKFGKNKILPSISPKKSWEGFIGGFIFTILASILCFNYIEFFLKIDNQNIITMILPFTATIGDFTVSYFKRKAKIKDSGNIIPGHGGMLDRMDALTLTIPVVYLINIFI